MLQAKTVADTLTGARFLMGLYLMWLGLRGGPEAMTIAVLMLLAAWISDVRLRGRRGGSAVAFRLAPPGLGIAGFALWGHDLDGLAGCTTVRGAARGLDRPGGHCHLAPFSTPDRTRVLKWYAQTLATTLRGEKC